PISHESVRHLLVGSPRVVKYTQGQLSQAGYAEMLRWTDLFSLTNGQLIITPGPSDVMSMLVKLVHLV
ncbi:MAG: hypothetical protein HC873_00890, partial [Leptolyngbyaceae cyanobacterium SL_1_1]|nr:hypothetical protein [Leptolyngbyaceae cyanobacterium SL_1_1]